MTHLASSIKLALGLSFFLFAGLATSACSDNGKSSDDEQPADPDGEPEIGESSFVSADGQAGESAVRGGEEVYDSDDASVEGDNGGDTREVEEGDIYRMGDNDILFNLNSYRGLQVIDLADVENPRVIGRLPLSGYPVEMYVTDTHVYMLVNHWQGYWGTRADIAIESYNGGLLVAADISDLEHPVETDRALVPGYIQTSRLIGNSTDKAIYVAASNWNGDTETVVKSFAVTSAGAIEERTTLDLGGYVQDIQASAEMLMVARIDWSADRESSTVSVIDVSDPDGTMLEGAEIQVEGMIRSKTNMNLHGNILRLVSGSSWSGANTNHLETFDVTDITDPVAIDHDTFGEGEDLYATLFLGNKAFFVTYFRTDPFHAFEIDDAGNAEERAEYVISGWNDFFKPVFDETRIIGVGTDDEDGRAMSVSLYDITDLANPDPFIDRQAVSTTDYSWSEASWDDRAFSVLENATLVTAPDGTEETGLVLLPFNGYDYDDGTYIAAVQIFTFSKSTLTRRGVMDHGTQVRRSFNADAGVTANLSEQALSLFDTEAPDTPAELGRVELAPDYEDFLVFGKYGVRVKPDAMLYYYWRESLSDSGKTLEVVPVGDPETATPLAAIEVGAYANVVKVGSLLVALSSGINEAGDKDTVLVQVVDMTDPTAPRMAAELVSDELNPYGGYYGIDYDMDYYYGYWNSVSALAVGDVLVFPEYDGFDEVLGSARTCEYYNNNSYERCYDENWEPIEGCTFVDGYMSCTSVDGEPEYCSGGFYECEWREDYEQACERVEVELSEMDMSCYTYDRTRYWNRLAFRVLDLRDPENPVLSERYEMPKREEFARILAKDDALYVTHTEPVDIENDSREYVRYFFKKVDLADPASPDLGDKINIPGWLLQVDGDTIYTQDVKYGDEIVESAVNRLRVADGKAYLEARKRFADREVARLVTDENGNALVTDRAPYYGWYGSDDDEKDKLTILDAKGDMDVLGEFEVDRWSELRAAENHRALFSVPGGILIVNIADPSAPFAQAYFALLGWPRTMVVEGDQVYMPAGPYGIYNFDIDTFNLL